MIQMVNAFLIIVKAKHQLKIPVFYHISPVCGQGKVAPHSTWITLEEKKKHFERRMTSNMERVTAPQWITCKDQASISLLELRVRLWTVVAQLAADWEVSPEGVSQVLHPIVSRLSS